MTDKQSETAARPTLDEALTNAGRCLQKAEDAPPEMAAKLTATASRWLDMANILLALNTPFR